MLNQSDDFLTVDEVCELLKIGHNAAYRMLNTGEMIFQNHNPWASTLDTQSRMLCTQLVFCFVSHLNNTPKPDSSQEPGFVFGEHITLCGSPVFVFISLTAPDRTSNQALLSVLSIFREWHLFGHSHDCWSPPAQPDSTTFRADYRAM